MTKIENKIKKISNQLEHLYSEMSYLDGDIKEVCEFMGFLEVASIQFMVTLIGNLDKNKRVCFYKSWKRVFDKSLKEHDRLADKIKTNEN